MEEIIEIFADAISAFILKSISLQEQNAAPGPELKQHAGVVVETSHTLVKITRDVAESDYRNYPDIKIPILNCAGMVEQAVTHLQECIRILFSDADRAHGWKKLVDSTRQIGEQTSKLLVVIYGAEQKRLERAARAALAAIAKVKAYAFERPEELRMHLKTMADDTADASSKVTQFNTYLGGRYQAEKEADLKATLFKAFNDINEHNQYLINDANDVLSAPTDAPRRKALVKSCDTLRDIIDAIMGNIRRPEDLDAFRIIEELFDSSNRATHSAARGYSDLNRTRPVDYDELEAAAVKLREAIIRVKNHRTYEKPDVLNNTNIGSARMAKFTELVDCMAHQPPVGLQARMGQFVVQLNTENANMINDTNDYLKTQKGDAALLAEGSGVDVSNEMDTIKTTIKSTLLGAKDFMSAPGTGQFVPKAKQVGGTVKELLAAVNSMVDRVNDATITQGLSDSAATARQAIVSLVNAGKAVHANPQDGAAGQGLQDAVSTLQVSIRGLLREANQVQADAATPKAAAPAASSGSGASPDSKLNPESRKLETTADRILVLIDDVLAEVKPDFASARDLLGKASKSSLSPDQVTNSLLQRLADDALRALEQMKPYSTFTPAETLEALEYAVEAVDLFADRAGTRAQATKLAQLRRELQQAVDGINHGNKSLIDNTENYISKPTAANDRALMGNIEDLQDRIRRLMKEMRPDDIHSVPAQYYGQNVTPADLARQAEQVKKGTAATAKYADQSPAETARAAQDTADKLSTFNAMVDKLSSDTTNPAYKNILSSAQSKLHDADRDFVTASNAYFDDPTSVSAQKGVDNSCAEVDRLLDDLMEELMPESHVAAGKRPGDVSPLALQRLADKAKHDAHEVKDDYSRLPPKELVKETATASQSAADFAEGLKARAAQEQNPELKRALTDAARRMDEANAGLVSATNNYIRNPNDAAAGRAIEARSDDVKRIADDIMAKLRPRAGVAPDTQGRMTQKVTPKMVEDLGRRVQAAAAKVKQRDGKSPNQVAQEAANASALTEQLAHMVDSMEGQQTRPAVKNRLRGAVGELRTHKVEVPERTNAWIDEPEEARTQQALDTECQDLHDCVEKLIKDVKPKVEVARATSAGSEGCTPQDLARAAEEARQAIRKVRDNHKGTDPDQLTKDAADASAKVATFQGLVDARAKADQRAGVQRTLAEAVPKLEAGNKRFVDGTNTFISDPSDPSTSREVVGSSDNLLDIIDGVMGSVMPQSKFADGSELRGNYGNLTNDQLKASFDEVRAAVVRVKQFPSHEPTQIAGNTDDASKKLAVFCKQLDARAGETAAVPMQQVLKQGSSDLTHGNRDMVNSSNTYLGDPDHPAHAEDLDGACANLLDTLDNLWAEVNPVASVPSSKSGQHLDTSPLGLEALAERVKAAVTEVEGHRNHTAKQHVDKTQEAAGLGALFSEAVGQRSREVTQPDLKRKLAKAEGDLARANERIVAATNANVASGQSDARAQREVDDACAAMKALVDEVMGEIRPVAKTQAASGNVSNNPSPSDLEAAARALIASCNKVQEFPNNTPKQTVANTEDASSKAATLSALAKAAEGRAGNSEVKRILGNAANELDRGNVTLVDSTNAYVATPNDAASQAMVHDSAENLKRIAQDLIASVKPTMDAPQASRNLPSNVSLAQLRDAYEKAKASLDTARNNQGKAPRQQAAETQKATSDAQYFKDLAQVRVNAMPGETRDLKDAVAALDRANHGFHDTTNAYFADPNRTNEGKVKASGTKLDSMLDTVMGSLQPKAVYTKPDLRKPARPVPAEEIQAKADGVSAGALGRLGHFVNKGEDVVAADATETSAELAAVCELVSMKGREEGQTPVSKAKLRDLSMDLDRRNKSLVNATNAWIKDKDDADKQAKLRNAVKNVKLTMNNAVAAAQAADRKQKSFEDEIDEAAAAMRRACAEWDADEEIVGAALRIAEEMRLLAAAARRMDRKAIIQHSRNIAALVKSEIVAYAKPIQAGCRDKTISRDIGQGVQAMGNFSTQLKIIASIKASALGTNTDKTAENQLVACCQGIATSMRATLKGSQAAKVAQRH